MTYSDGLNKASYDYSSYQVGCRILKDYVSLHKGKVLFAALFMVIVAMSDAFLVWLIRPALDKVLIAKDIVLFWVIPALIVAIACVKGIADYVQSYLIKSVGQHVVNDIQLKLYSHLVHADLDFLNQYSSGHFLSKFTNDITNIRLAITTVVVNFAKELLTIIFVVGLMFYHDYRLTLITFAVFSFMVFPIMKGGKKMKKITHATQAGLSDYTKYLNERLHNIKIIKSFCNESYEIREGNKYLANLLSCYKRSVRLESIISPIMELLSSIAIALVIAYGGYNVLKGVTTPGSLMLFIAAFIMVYKPVKSFAGMNLVVQAGVVSAKRILSVLDKKNIIEGERDKKDLRVKTGKIKFDKIFFSYDKKHPTIQNLSLQIKSGQVVAIVGESGSGKSTIVDLLLKFYNPQQGGIYIDGQNLADVTTESIRQNIAIVNQDVLLFDASVKENILYGNRKAKDEDVVTAAAVSNAEEFISNMQKKYNTIVGKFGIKVSGGQRQKIAIARAVIKDAPILILDEATSSLDQVSETYVKNAILSLRDKYKVIIIITHRLNAIKSSDVIYVMKKGKIGEFGSHKELLDNRGEYYRLYNKKIIT